MCQLIGEPGRGVFGDLGCRRIDDYSDQIDAFSQALDRAFNRRRGEWSSKHVAGLI